MLTSPERSGPSAPSSEQPLSMAAEHGHRPGSQAQSLDGAACDSGNVVGRRLERRAARRRQAGRGQDACVPVPVSRSTSIVREAQARSSASTSRRSRQGVAAQRAEAMRALHHPRDARGCHHRACSRNEATAGSEPVRQASSAASMSPARRQATGHACGRRSAGARAGPRGEPCAVQRAMAVPRQAKTSVSTRILLLVRGESGDERLRRYRRRRGSGIRALAWLQRLVGRRRVCALRLSRTVPAGQHRLDARGADVDGEDAHPSSFMMASRRVLADWSMCASISRRAASGSPARTAFRTRSWWCERDSRDAWDAQAQQAHLDHDLHERVEMITNNGFCVARASAACHATSLLM